MRDTPSELTVAAYAERIGCSEGALLDRGLTGRMRGGVSSVRLPFRNRTGAEIAARYLKSGIGDELQRDWTTTSVPSIFNQPDLELAVQQAEVVLTLDEECALAFATAGAPAVSLPADCNWMPAWGSLFDGIERIVLVATDSPPEWIAGSKLARRMSVVELDSPTLTALRRMGDHDFVSTWSDLRRQAVPWNEQRRRLLAQQAAGLTDCPDVLAALRDDCAEAGFAGDTRATELAYLAITSRVFARPASLAVKGPASAGKNRAIEEALVRMPASASVVRTQLSAKAVFYTKEPFEHRTLVLLEAGVLRDTDMAGPIRQLLSEGKLIYEYTDSEAQSTVVLVKDGPTNLLTTTTLVHLDPELETRLMSTTVSDTPEQTRQVLLAQAGRYDASSLDHSRWQAFGEWVAVGACDVVVPYAGVLADAIVPAAVRLRRDFPTILTLIEAHALIHQINRDRDEKGRVVATVADYAAVHRLVAEIVSEGAERSVRPSVRETIEAVASIMASKGYGEGVTINALADELKIDTSAARRRAMAAESAGLLLNKSQSRRRKLLELGDRLPEQQEILPSPEDLDAACRRARTLEPEADGE